MKTGKEIREEIKSHREKSRENDREYRSGKRDYDISEAIHRQCNLEIKLLKWVLNENN